jgi:hypothetical protein
MKPIACLILVCSVTYASAATRLQLELSDSSSIVGEPRDDTVPLVTSIATIEVRYAHVRTIEFLGGGQVVVTFANGDRLTGRTPLPVIVVKTLFGRHAIDIQLVRRLSVLAEAAPDDDVPDRPQD